MQIRRGEQQALVVAAWLGLCATALPALGAPRADLLQRDMSPRQPPKALQYRALDDRVISMESVYYAPASTIHDRAAYHGNRLTQFRYLGPRATGGIYDAFEIERETRALDPAKYRYHWGRWP